MLFLLIYSHFYYLIPVCYSDPSFFLYSIKNGNGIKCLFPLSLGLVIICQFLNKRRKIFLVCWFVMIFKPRIQIGAYPENPSYHNPPVGAASSREIK